jgi:hypothetical protein
MPHICLGCKLVWLRYLVLGFTVLITLVFGIPATALCVIHVKNYMNGQTTNERLSKRNRSESLASNEDSSNGD